MHSECIMSSADLVWKCGVVFLIQLLVFNKKRGGWGTCHSEKSKTKKMVV